MKICLQGDPAQRNFSIDFATFSISVELWQRVFSYMCVSIKRETHPFFEQRTGHAGAQPFLRRKLE